LLEEGKIEELVEQILAQLAKTAAQSEAYDRSMPSARELIGIVAGTMGPTFSQWDAHER
jgi:hypothetical protein